MKNYLYPLLLLIVLSSLSTGCVSTYMPNVPNVPMFTQQGELSAGGHITPKGNITFNTAYAVSDHFAVLLNGSMLNSERRKRDFQHNLLEAAGGYYTSFGDNNERILEVYGGIGGGSSDRTERKTNEQGVLTAERREAKFSKVFGQVNFTSKKKKSLQLLGREYPLNYGTALRVSYINMGTHRLNGMPAPEESNIFLEPIFYTRLQLNSSVQLQYTTGSNFGLRNRKSLTAGYSVFSAGFVINVGGREIKKKK